MMRRAWVVVVVAGLAGCGGWLQAGSDAGRTRANGVEDRLSVTTVGSLVDHVIPTSAPGDAPAQVAVGRVIIGSAGGNLSALDAATCPAPGDAACAPRWSRTTANRGLLASDGVTVWAAGGGGASGANVVAGTRVNDGSPVWSATFPYGVGTDNPQIRDLAVSFGHVIAAVDTLDHGTSRYTRTVRVMTTKGCGAATCPAIASFPTLGTTNLAVEMFTAYALVSNVEDGNLVTRLEAIDIDSGEMVWRSAWSAPDDGVHTVHGAIVVGNNRVYFSDDESGATSVYSTDFGYKHCQGTPRTCTAIGELPGLAPYAPVEATSARVTMTGGERLSWFPAACSGICVAGATTVSTGAANPTAVRAVAGGLVIATRGNSVLAYDETATTGCSGSPKVCTPVWTHAFSGETVDDAFVWDARLYVRTHAPTTGATHQHVFTLPG